MARRRHTHTNDDAALRVLRVLRSHAMGMHHIGEPAAVLDASLPASLASVFRQFNGATLFHETLYLAPCADVALVDDGPRDTTCYRVGALDGDDLLVDTADRVYRFDSDLDEWLQEGSHFIRWLHGIIDAEALLYEPDGEFSDNAFEATGEPTKKTAVAMYRRLLERDRHAPAPRWRLARALLDDAQTDARDHLEQVIADAPAFSWAWFDLGRISESLRQFDIALDEYQHAAICGPGVPFAGFFFAHAARIAVRQRDEARRVILAQQALNCDPSFARSQRDGAAALLSADSGDDDSVTDTIENARAALELAELAAAVAPTDLMVIDILARARRAVDTASPGDTSPGNA